jgi:hypothetical protein
MVLSGSVEKLWFRLANTDSQEVLARFPANRCHISSGTSRVVCELIRWRRSGSMGSCGTRGARRSLTPMPRGAPGFTASPTRCVCSKGCATGYAAKNSGWWVRTAIATLTTVSLATLPSNGRSMMPPSSSPHKRRIFCSRRSKRCAAGGPRRRQSPRSVLAYASIPRSCAAVPPRILIRSSSLSPGIAMTWSTGAVFHGNG